MAGTCVIVIKWYLVVYAVWLCVEKNGLTRLYLGLS